MPVYEYRCTKCGARIEKFAPMGEASQSTICPHCSSIAQRVFSRIGIICRWGTGIVGGERMGYRPGEDNPESEVKADMKALAEKMQHTNNPKKRHEFKEALQHFECSNQDVLK